MNNMFVLTVLQEQPELWTDDLTCPLSGVGSSTNQIYRENGLRREGHECEDRSFHYRFPLITVQYTAVLLYSLYYSMRAVND